MRLYLVGGFLGSGKTTAITQAAQIFIEQGKRVGIVTNEQGKHLVDTAFLRSKSLPTLEVTGGCICCHLDDFNERVDELTVRYHPDVIFAESVGSCADLVATVLKPLMKLRADFDQPTSLSVFTDARLFYRYLNGLELPFSEEVIYTYEKQLEEGGLIVINKSDLLDEKKTAELLPLAAAKYPGKIFRLQNSLKASQVKEWLELLDSPESSQPRISMDMDYDRYASGEKRFCWVDREIKISADDQEKKIHLLNIIQRICRKLSGQAYSIAHLKFLLDDGRENIKFNLTALDDLDSKFEGFSDSLRALKGSTYSLRINAMIEGPLEAIEENIDTIISSELNSEGIDYSVLSGFTRVPGYPKPTMRIGNS
ncbi:GTP-binding protein [Pelolinea submarina]|uniref:CobW/HypB/UreG family nucleotide-binding protein n=1 Tax=Pelolinea submarina TaxID=913107 RepID=A0A3E0A302_9CHLR|nr:GTP-binding protein [Pelolinea submarina]REG04711.1 CobW/HypB/UreG family nucleotide-binding protein [Pelolinea submarina]